jgi:hypothetical protein
MPITPNNPFKGRQHPGELIVLCVRWYLRYPLSYEHVTELMAERDVEVDASCIWRWVQAYAPELNKRCRSNGLQQESSTSGRAKRFFSQRNHLSLQITQKLWEQQRTQ